MTRLRCGGKFNDSFIANFLQIVIMKKFRKSAVFDEVMPKILQTLFSGHGLVCTVIKQKSVAIIKNKRTY